MSDDVLFTVENHLGFITLNRPKALNALTLAMINALYERLVAWEKDEKIHAVIVRATPGKAFCAGGDVRWLYEVGKKKFTQQMQFFKNEYRLNYLIQQYKKPYIALMDGITMGGGVGISMHGSHPIATERFIFAMPETAIGFFPDIGACYLLSRCPGSIGEYLALTGERLNAPDAAYCHLTHCTVASETLDAIQQALLTMDLREAAHKKVSDCLANYKIDRPPSSLKQHRDVIDRCYQADTLEEIIENVQTVPSVWIESHLATLLKKAPLSLKVTREQIRKARSLAFKDCLKLDWQLVQHFMKDENFYEGVRALLVEKDLSPHWVPGTLQAVNMDLVEGFFHNQLCKEDLF